MDRENILSKFKNWKLIDQYADKILVDQFSISLAGFACENDQGIVLSGSAGGNDHIKDRAFYELLERLSIFEFHHLSNEELLALKDQNGINLCVQTKKELIPQSENSNWRFAISNGVAIHQDFEKASNHAMRELLERDAILASWYGLTSPKKVACSNQVFPKSYHLEFYQFETLNGYYSAMCLARPLVESAPLLYGFSCASSFEIACNKAQEELIQRIGFLFNEVGETELRFEPTALFLQEYYLRKENHHKIYDWLEGKHGAIGRASRDATICFIDLTPQSLENLTVVKALSDETIPLIFGQDYSIRGIKIKKEWEFHPVV